MAVQVKLMVVVKIDPEDYMMPSDGDVREEFSEAVREYFHDISGTEIKYIRVIQEGNNG